MTLAQQREEKLKEFVNKFGDTLENVNCNSGVLQNFISNIYIKMAEENIERLKLLAQSYLMNTEWDMSKAVESEISYWQEELNKLK